MRAPSASAPGGLTDLLFDIAGVGLCLVAPDGTVVRANSEWLRKTGFTAEQVIGADLVELFPATRDLTLALHARAREGHRIEVPRHVQKVNGRETWWEGSIDPVPMEGGAGLLITAREVDAAEVRRAEEHAVVAAIGRIFENALSAESEEDLGRVCLAVAEEVTGSAFGFLAEINPRTGRLDDIAISDPGWDACRMTDAVGHGKGRVPVEFTIHGLYGRVLLEARTVLTNDPRAHPDSIGTPPGHPPLRAFLGVPLVHGGATWGMVAVGNREGGYGPAERTTLEALAPAIVQAFMRKRAEQAERDQRAEAQRRAAELQALLDTVPAAVWISRDPRGDRIDANRFGAELLRRPRGSNISLTAPRSDERPMNFRPTVAGRELSPDELPMQAAARFGHDVRDVEFDLTFDDGTVRHLLGNAAPILDEHGAPCGSVGAFIDITDRKQSEAALRAGEEEARARAALVEAVLDCIGDGVIVYDRHGRTVRSTPAADAMLRLPAAERLGPVADRVMRQYEILTEDGRRLGPDEMVAVRAAVYGETVRGAILQVRSGNHDPRWLLISGMPLFVGGEHTGAVLSMTDITERKRADAELATVTRLYAVLTRVNEAIVRTRDEASLYAEVCRIVAASGFPLVWVGLVEGRTVVPAASSGSAVAYLRDVRVELDGPLGEGPTGTCIREDRPVINDDFAANPATWPWREATARHGLRASAAFPIHRDGDVIGAVMFYAASAGAFVPEQVKLLESLCADVSYALDALARDRLRAQAEASLREADRRKDEFLGMLSHELRNPLAPIRNSTYILRHAPPGSTQALRAQKVIERQTEHLTRLVDDLLDVTRIARGKIELRRTRVDLREVVWHAADDSRLALDERGVTFRSVFPEAKVWADGDPTRITQVVGNLLHNASKFTRRGDEVVLSLEADGTEATIRVRDTGAGIEPELLPKVFEPFIQGERTLARTDGGLGLGLALVKGITELHGGTVRADSAGKGKGSEFVVRLPLRANADTASRPGRRSERPSGGLRVLVVDDNHDSAESLAEIVTMLGHAVEVAYDGPSAIEKARANPPDIVLCDLGLPGMSGYEVAMELRQAADGMQLFAVSGYAQPEDVKRAIAAGFDGHLAKPLKLDDVERLLS